MLSWQNMSKKLPLQVGVTGGIGSGKSMVCRLFACLGIPVYDADSKAKLITTTNPEIRQKITGLLGENAYLPDGSYNRAYVSSKVFKDSELLTSLNAIIHPAVLRDTEQWVNNHIGFPYVIKEAALMNKAGQGNSLDFVVVVDAPAELRVKRILERDKRAESEIKAIIARQVSDADRKQIADFLVHNDQNSALIPQVLELHARFISTTR
jgi:dephospho-CoA kinase